MNQQLEVKKFYVKTVKAFFLRLRLGLDLLYENPKFELLIIIKV